MLMGFERLRELFTNEIDTGYLDVPIVGVTLGACTILSFGLLESEKAFIRWGK